MPTNYKILVTTIGFNSQYEVTTIHTSVLEFEEEDSADLALTQLRGSMRHQTNVEQNYTRLY